MYPAVKALVDQTLKRILAQHFNGSKEQPGVYRQVKGLDQLDKMIVIDQSPIGRTPRSNPLPIRVLLPKFGCFLPLYRHQNEEDINPVVSFNVKGGVVRTVKGMAF